MKFNYALLLLYSFLSANLLAQAPTLVTDLNQGEGDGLTRFDSKGFPLGERLLISASDGSTGKELYVIDDSGITLLKDINEGEGDSNPRDFTLYNNKVYFIAGDVDNGVEVWSTDGTPEGTMLAIDVVSGSGSSYPSQLWVSSSNQLFFSANDFLYVSDGTTEGTSRISNLGEVSLHDSDVYASSRASLYREGLAFFDEFGSTFRIWAYQADTLKKLYELQGFSTDIYGLHEVEKGLVFTRDACCGSEADLNGLYLYDQALDSTYRVVDGDGSPYEPNRVWSFVEGKIAFLDRGNGYFISDGTTEGTIKTSDNTPFSITQGSAIQNITVNGKMIHWEDKDGFDETLVITNGTVQGSKELVRLDELFTSEFVAKDQYVFWTNGISNGFSPSIWMADIESEEAEKIHTFTEDPGAISSVLPVGVIGNQLYLAADLDNQVGRELYSFTLDFISNATDISEYIGANYRLTHTSGERWMEVNTDATFEMVVVKLFDSSGRIIHQSRRETGIRFEVAVKREGVYILNVEGEQGVQVFKVYMK